MGWNAGYTIFEETVIGAYNLGVLDTALLKVLMEPYRATDIDSGGSRDLQAKDGLSVEEVVIKIMEPRLFKTLNEARVRISKFPKDWKKQTKKQREAIEAYYESRYKVFHNITDKKFGWM